jgi:hypothetical protein
MGRWQGQRQRSVRQVLPLMALSAARSGRQRIKTPYATIIFLMARHLLG